MFKKVISTLLMSSAISVSAAEDVEIKTRNVQYPALPTLTISVPEDWETYDKTRFGVESPNKKLEVAGTVYNSGKKSIEEFTKDKHDAILKKMSWYKATTDLTKLSHAKYPSYIKEYQGVWPKEDKPTSYVVTTMFVDGYYLSLTFVALTDEIGAYRDNIDSIIKSVNLK